MEICINVMLLKTTKSCVISIILNTEYCQGYNITQNGARGACSTRSRNNIFIKLSLKNWWEESTLETNRRCEDNVEIYLTDLGNEGRPAEWIHLAHDWERLRPILKRVMNHRSLLFRRASTSLIYLQKSSRQNYTHFYCRYSCYMLRFWIPTSEQFIISIHFYSANFVTMGSHITQKW
jgi:hypothetical protein